MPRRDLLGLFPPKVFETNQGSERFKNIEGCPKILIHILIPAMFPFPSSSPFLFPFLFNF